MASSSEAFTKFSQWKKDKTFLTVTVIERGNPEDVLPNVYIFGVDEEASQVGVVQPSTRGHAAFDVGESDFSIEYNRVVASREDVEWLIFEVENSEA